MLHFANWKISIILGICFFGLAFAAPNLLDRETAASLPDSIPHKQISLGLDLQGGSHLLLEVDTKTVIRERLSSLVETVRTTLRKDRVGYRGLGIDGNAVQVTIRKPEQYEAAFQSLRTIDQGAPGLRGENGIIRMELTELAVKERIKSAVDQSIEIVRRRIDETGVREPTIQRQGEDRILIQLPGVDDPERIKDLLGQTAKMSFHITNDNVTPGGKAPLGSHWLPHMDNLDAAGQPQKILVRKRVVVSGENLTDSQPTFDNGRPVVNFRFDSLGAKKFGDVTTKNVNRRLAIVLDGKVISAPRINEPILGGSGIITGQFTTQGAQDLALLLRAGALPAPLTILEERTVGPGLGADSIAAGKVASILGLVGVIIFMVFTYRTFGLFADVALMVNMVLIMGALSALQATLTLPGIAGIVLTIGMAVDANVLVFERIREEAAAGRGIIGAIEAGYKRAITTIVDANVTTLIAAILLFEFGSGPVRGFAVTLAVGIASSMFTATMLTRYLVSIWVKRKRPKELPV